MANNRENYPYIIPMIWQYDGHTSPNINGRVNLYNIPGTPVVRWGGTRSDVGFNNNSVVAYNTSYHTFVNNPAPIDIIIDLEITDNTLTANATIVKTSPITNPNNTKVIFIITYDRQIEQPGHYFASVVRYEEQTYQDDKDVYTQNITLDDWWDHRKASLVVIVQNFSSPLVIHNAKQQRLFDNIPPENIIASTNGSRVALTWEKPASFDDVMGYNVFKNGVKINAIPLRTTNFIDYQITADTKYEYAVTTVYRSRESAITETIEITPKSSTKKFIQLGAGPLVNDSETASPINITHRSLRNQMLYTAGILNLAGLPKDASITHIGFYVHEAPALALPAFRLRMKHTSIATLTSHDSGPWTLDYGMGPYTPTAGDWDMIELNNAFTWNGSNHILIDTAFNLVETATNAGRVRIINYTNGYRYSRSNQSSQVNTATTDLVNYLPQLMIYYEADTNQNLAAPSVLAANSVSNGINLTWHSPTNPHTTLEGFRIYRDGLVLDFTSKAQTSYFDTSAQKDASYTYRVTAIYFDGESDPSNTVTVTHTVSQTDHTMINADYMLIGNYPNPFNPTTNIKFGINNSPSSGEGSKNITINIYNIKGQKIRTLVDGLYPVGEHSVVWNGTDDIGNQVGSGIYFYRMETDGFTATRKMILIK